MTLSQKILILRKKAGLSQEELANRLDVSRQTVYKWESDLATPEIEKIKNIAKMFDVSFDYLMDDEIETYEKTTTKKKIKTREVYYTGENLSIDHADLDHGYTRDRKAKNINAEDLFDDNVEKMTNVLYEIGATEIIRIQPDATIAYFYNSEEHSFGFYYQGKIQFVCPVENFVSLQIIKDDPININTRTSVVGLGFGDDGINSVGYGSLPSTSTVGSSYVSVTLLYKDGKDTIKELKLGFSVASLYISHTIKDIQEWEFQKSILMSALMKNLNNISAKLNAYAKESKNIRNGSTTVEDIDIDFYETKNSELEEEYKTYIEELEESASAANGFRIVKIGILAVLGVVGLIAGFFILTGMMGL